jgi:hypothetical protein
MKWSEVCVDLVNEPCWSMQEFRREKCVGCEPPDSCPYAPFLGAIPFASIEQIGKALKVLTGGIEFPKFNEGGRLP